MPEQRLAKCRAAYQEPWPRRDGVWGTVRFTVAQVSGQEPPPRRRPNEGQIAARILADCAQAWQQEIKKDRG